MGYTWQRFRGAGTSAKNQLEFLELQHRTLYLSLCLCLSLSLSLYLNRETQAPRHVQRERERPQNAASARQVELLVETSRIPITILVSNNIGLYSRYFGARGHCYGYLGGLGILEVHWA